MASGGRRISCYRVFAENGAPATLARVTPRAFDSPIWCSSQHRGVHGLLLYLKHTAPHVASSYAYVNPVVAVLLGRLILGEPLTWRVLVATALIVPGVLAMTLMPMKQEDLNGSKKSKSFSSGKPRLMRLWSLQPSQLDVKAVGGLARGLLAQRFYGERPGVTGNHPQLDRVQGRP